MHIQKLISIAIVLQALLLFTPVRAFANTGEDQEIGVPQAIEESVYTCFGAALSPDGNHFYTAHEDGVITQYRINPFKKLSSVAFDREQLKDLRGRVGSQCHLLITSDEKKLIIRLRHKLLLIDTGSGRILNKYAPVGYDVTISNAIMNDGELVLFEADYEQRVYKLIVLDANTLSKKREIKNLGEIIEISQGGIPFFGRYRDRIYFAWSQYRLLVLNSKTYTPELSLFSRGGHGEGVLPHISRDYQTLYYKNVYKVTDYMTGKQTNLEVPTWGRSVDVLVFDQRTRESRIENTNTIPKKTLVEFFLHPVGASRAHNYLLATIGRSASTGGIANLETGTMLYRFYQYADGEAILIEEASPGEYRHFQLTSSARKYLMMKNREGNVIPINDATFANYFLKNGLH